MVDANDILRERGTDGLRHAADNAKAFPFSTPVSRLSSKTEIHSKSQTFALGTAAEYRKAKSTSHSGMIVDGLIRAGTLVSVGARPGWGKTALLIEMAKNISEGTSFINCATKKSAVVFIAVEDNDDVVNRIQAARAGNVLVIINDERIAFDNSARLKMAITQIIASAKSRVGVSNAVVIIDTFRAALGGKSVLEDKNSAPVLNALREVAEETRAAIVLTNHTNRENTKQSKGETLEAVCALELIIQPGESGSYNIFVEKNRSGPGHRKIGNVRYTSVKVGAVSASIVDKLTADTTTTHVAPRVLGKNQATLLKAFVAIEAAQGFDHTLVGSTVVVKAVTEVALRKKFEEMMSGAASNTIQVGFTRASDATIAKRMLFRGDDGYGSRVYWSKE